MEQNNRDEYFNVLDLDEIKMRYFHYEESLNSTFHLAGCFWLYNDGTEAYIDDEDIPTWLSVLHKLKDVDGIGVEKDNLREITIGMDTPPIYEDSNKVYIQYKNDVSLVALIRTAIRMAPDRLIIKDLEKYPDILSGYAFAQKLLSDGILDNGYFEFYFGNEIDYKKELPIDNSCFIRPAPAPNSKDDYAICERLGNNRAQVIFEGSKEHCDEIIKKIEAMKILYDNHKYNLKKTFAPEKFGESYFSDDLSVFIENAKKVRSLEEEIRNKFKSYVKDEHSVTSIRSDRSSVELCNWLNEQTIVLNDREYNAFRLACKCFDAKRRRGIALSDDVSADELLKWIKRDPVLSVKYDEYCDRQKQSQSVQIMKGGKNMAMETDFLWDCKAKQIRLDMVPENRCFKGAVVFENKDGSNRICDIRLEGFKCQVMTMTINDKVDVGYCLETDLCEECFDSGKAYFTKYGAGRIKETGKYNELAAEIDKVIDYSEFYNELNKIYNFASIIVKNDAVFFDGNREKEINWGKSKFLKEICAEYDIKGSAKKMLKWALEINVEDDYIKMLAQNGYNYEQMTELLLGITENHTKKMIEMYSSPRYTYNQMSEISMGFSQGLTVDQVKMYARSEFDSNQMHEIRLALQDGLDEEHIRIMCNPEFDKSQLAQLRLGFNMGLPLEDVMVYASPKFSADSMNVMRKELGEDMKKKRFKEADEKYLCILAKQGDEFETIDLSKLPEKKQFEVWKLIERYSKDCESLTGTFKECMTDLNNYDDKDISR